MLRIFSILLVIACMFQHVGFDELVKTENFIAHYTKHKQQNGELTLLRFIDMHYLGHDVGDDDDDQSLPFKTYNYQHCLNSPVTVTEPIYVAFSAATDCYLSINFPLHRQEVLPTFFFAKVFQPPRLS